MTILAAIDVTKTSERLLSTAHDLAQAYDDQLAVLYVVKEEVYENRRQDLTRRDERAEYPISRAEDEAAGEVKEALEATLDRSDRDSVYVVPVGRIGEPVEEILEAAAERDAHYLVIGGRKRTPTGKALFGSTTQSILLNADRPVVTVMRG
jgi:nucleotide-binding universal stress UspA family protein